MQNNITDLDEIKDVLRYNRISFLDLKDFDIKILFYQKILDSGGNLSFKQEADYFKCKQIKNNEELGMVKEKLKTPEQIIEENKLKAEKERETKEDPLKKFIDSDKEGDELINQLNSKYPSRDVPIVENKHQFVEEDDKDEIEKDFDNEFNEDEEETPSPKEKKLSKKELKKAKKAPKKKDSSKTDKSKNAKKRKIKLYFLAGITLVWIGLMLYNHMH